MGFFPSENVGAMAEENLRSFHQRFAQSGVGVHDLGEVMSGRPHFYSHRALTDEFAGTVTDNADAKNPFGARFDDEFGQTIGSVVGQSATTSAPREFGDFDWHPFGFGFGFSESYPSHFWVGEDHSGDEVIAIHRVPLPGDIIDGDPSFLAGFMGEHNPSGDITDRIDVRISRCHFLVDSDEPLIVFLDGRIFQTKIVTIGNAPNRTKTRS